MDHLQDDNSAKSAVHDLVETAKSFADTFVEHIAAPAATCGPHELRTRRREACAAVWAAIVATFEASELTERQKAKLIPFVRQEMLGAWNKHCTDDTALLIEITERSAHYLRNHDRRDQFATAAGIMKDLLEAIDPAAAQMLPVKRLSAMIAHRMLEDLRRLADLGDAQPED